MTRYLKSTEGVGTMLSAVGNGALSLGPIIALRAGYERGG